MKGMWEYKVIMSYGISDERTSKWEEELNRWGSEGWELVSAFVKPEVPATEATASTHYHTREPKEVMILKRARVE